MLSAGHKDRESLIEHITKAMEALQRQLALEAKKR
jgi:hypothetical protein